jgi:hypothetical protein
MQYNRLHMPVKTEPSHLKLPWLMPNKFKTNQQMQVKRYRIIMLPRTLQMS